MLTINKAMRTIFALMSVITMLTACNKELPEAVPIERPPNGTGPTIATILNDPGFSILKAAVTKANLMTGFADSNLRLTLIAPDDAAFIASGLPLIAITDVLTVEQVTGLVSYMTLPQVVGSANIPTSFPNLQYPSILNPLPTNPAAALLRLTTFPSKRGAVSWVNNIPIIAADIVASNGVVLKVARVVAPPTQFLWDRINADADMTIFKAVIQRADSAGAVLVPALNNIGANFNVFVPTNLAMKNLISALTGGLIPVGAPDAVFIGFIGGNNITTRTATGLVAYHIFDGRDVTNKSSLKIPRPGRVFSVNFPTAPPNIYKTLLNSDSAAALHPGVTLQATFGATGVTAATVKGLHNVTASNVLINPTPAPLGTSDQHYLNGVIHKIDQVLLPLPL